MYNEGILISIDPGEKGALTLFKDGKWIKTIDYDLKEYRKVFESYDNFVVAIETIDPFPNRVLAFGQLKENVGKIKGQLETADKIYKLIEEGIKPMQWKKPYEGLVKPKGTTWIEYEEKLRAINKCKELYPELDIPFVHTVHHDDGTTTDYYKDGRADSCLIGDFILNYYEEPKPKEKTKKKKNKKKKVKEKK